MSLKILKEERDVIASLVDEIQTKLDELTAQKDRLKVVVTALEHELDAVRRSELEQLEFAVVEE